LCQRQECIGLEAVVRVVDVSHHELTACRPDPKQGRLNRSRTRHYRRSRWGTTTARGPIPPSPEFPSGRASEHPVRNHNLRLSTSDCRLSTVDS
jgi:hypothetical protein